MVSNGEEQTVWRQRDADLSWKDINDEVIILDLQSALYLRLNPAGRVLWHRLEKGATRTQLGETLVEEFGLEEDAARLDVAAFLGACGQHGLVRESTS